MAEPDTSVQLTPASMDAAEIALLAAALAAAGRYLEFGAGGSTLLAVRARPELIVTVEGDMAWVERIREHPEIAAAEASSRLVLVPIDLGPIRAYSVPTDPGSSALWPAYHAAAWAHFGAVPPDLVLIDGRFRLACGLQAVLRCPPTTRLLIHDFWNRPAYHRLLDFTDTLERAGTMALLQPRRELDRAAAERLLAEVARSFD